MFKFLILICVVLVLDVTSSKAQTVSDSTVTSTVWNCSLQWTSNSIATEFYLVLRSNHTALVCSKVKGRVVKESGTWKNTNGVFQLLVTDETIQYTSNVSPSNFQGTCNNVSNGVTGNWEGTINNELTEHQLLQEILKADTVKPKHH